MSNVPLGNGVEWLLGSLRRIKEDDITDEDFT